jgi:hypothetical protein
MSDVHKHRCGLHLGVFERDERFDPPLAVPGCGYEWEHERIFLNSDDYANRHRCPRCGAGPWMRRVLSPEQTQRFSERVPGVLATVQTEQELVVIAGSILDVLGFDAARFALIEQRLSELRRK